MGVADGHWDFMLLHTTALDESLSPGTSVKPHTGPLFFLEKKTHITLAYILYVTWLVAT